MLQLAIHFAQTGDVIVVSAGEYEEAGSFGDVLGNACVAKGIAGIVTDTGVRDTADLIELGLPVFSRSVCIKGTVKETLGQINKPIVVGGQEIRPGDVIRGEADGLVTVRPEDAADVARRSAARDEAKAGYIEANLSNGVYRPSRLRARRRARAQVFRRGHRRRPALWV